MEIIAEFSIGQNTFVIHPTVINSMLVVAGLCIFLIIAGNQVKKADPSQPSRGLVLFLELLVGGLNGAVKAIMGAHNVSFAPFIGTLALYLITANLLGLIGLMPPTSDYNVTLALALFTCVMMYYQGIKSQGAITLFKSTVFGDFPFLFALNIIGELAKPISLSVRLFGNILSGTIILGLIYEGAGWLSIPFTPWLHGYFDVFSGLIQTLIFAMLTMIWTEGMTVEPKAPATN
ncbi:MAG: F0F1 ATP synthase subunit A [Turicibacter sp.]|nr:F0F1 ATP synthase subunit A [Turicibacter sp.]